MQLELTCKKCEDSFEVDFLSLSSEGIRCPGCKAKASDEQVEALTTGLEELFAAIVGLRRKFTIVGELDSDDLPPPFDDAPVEKGAKHALLDEDDDEEEDDDDEEDEDE